MFFYLVGPFVGVQFWAYIERPIIYIYILISQVIY